jgi:predicted enzyme related to lactoylglutathione lyase
MQPTPFLCAVALASILLSPTKSIAGPVPSTTDDIAVGPQYDTTHVYVAPDDFDRFVASFTGTFGGTTSKQGVFAVTPTPSQTMSQLVLTPVGTLSVFGFKTPIPYPFGSERTGYLVKDLDAAVRRAKTDGVDVIVTSFPDPIGRDAIIQWPGGVNMQLYWHTTAPSYANLDTVPENRIYVSRDKAAEFVRRFLQFSHGKLTADAMNAPGVEIGSGEKSYHNILLESRFGKINIIATDGHLPWPYGRETTGYEVHDVSGTIEKAKANGVTVLTQPVLSRGRSSAMLQFPGGFIAEIHAPIR